MERMKLAETVLLNLECLWVLQELDELWRSRDAGACELLNGLYERRPVGWQDVYPLARLNTVLALLVVPIAFASRLSSTELTSYGFQLKPEYEVLCRRAGQVCALGPNEFLRVLRNSLAHLPDFVSGESTDVNISFNEGILRCWSRSAEVVFLTEKGFIKFLRDFIYLCRTASGRIMEAQ